LTPRVDRGGAADEARPPAGAGFSHSGPGATPDVTPRDGPDDLVTPGLLYLDHIFPDIASNLALDEALLLHAETQGGGPVLRLWEPTGLAVVLGASGRRLDDVDVARCRADGVPVARRSSGGGTVVVGPGTLNVTVVLPADAAPGLDAVDTAQAYVLERTARALRRLDRAVGVKGHGDLTLGDRKFAGSAQRRLRKFFLVHASLLYCFPIRLVTRYLHLPARQHAYRARRSHDEFLTNLEVPRDDLVAAVRSAWPTTGSAAVPEGLVLQLLAEKFADPAWTERL